jgi:hypothetical protein
MEKEAHNAASLSHFAGQLEKAAVIGNRPKYQVDACES